MKRSNVAGINFALLTWDDLTSLTSKLADEIQKDEVLIQYDRIVALANGGLTMVRYLADHLNIKTINLLQISAYDSVAQQMPEPVLLQPLAINVSGEKILVFEDIVDSGATLKVVDNYFAALGVKEYKVAAQIQKNKAVRSADYVGEQIDDWIIFPYETFETIRDLNNQWLAKNLPESEIRENLSVIGFNESEINAGLIGAISN